MAGAKGKAASRRDSRDVNDLSITIELDDTRREYFLRTSVNPDLRDLRLTEVDLVNRALRAARRSRAGSFTIEDLAREGLHFISKRYIANRATDKTAATHGIAGSADDRLAEAVKECRRDGVQLSPSRVGNRAVPKVGHRTAERYLRRLGLLEEG